MSEQTKQSMLPDDVLAAIGDYGHAKYRHDNDIITLAAWEDLIAAIKRWHAAAIAAKDARIAELEQKIIGLEDAFASNLDYRAMYRQLRAQLVSQQQAEPEDPFPVCGNEVRGQGSYLSCECPAPKPATPSEDGPEEMQFAYLHPNGERHTVTVSREEVLREMPDFLFEKLCGNFCQCEPVGETNVVECNCDEYAEEFQLLAAEPNAVTKEVAELRAQHSRIVAAKDAEIARLSTLVEAGHKLAMDAACAEITALEEELAELRAQPDRQVGGDERVQQ